MSEKLSLKEILLACWNNGPADEIYNQRYKCEVTHEQADYIENDGLGCSRLDDVDTSADGYDPEEMETIKIAVEDYIDNNFKEDFFSCFNISDFKNNEEYSKDFIEVWIHNSLIDVCDLFKTFTIYSDEYEDIYLEVEYLEYRFLSELNPDWDKDKYLVEIIDLDEFVSNSLNFN